MNISENGDKFDRYDSDEYKKDQINVTNKKNAVGNKNHPQEKKSRRSSRDTKKRHSDEELISRLELHILQETPKSTRKSKDAVVSFADVPEIYSLSSSHSKIKGNLYKPLIKHQLSKDLDSKGRIKISKFPQPKKSSGNRPNLSSYAATELETVKEESTKHHFLTGSHYHGIWDKATQCMNNYGTYRYSDGSVYRGYFSRGHFHGYGTLYLAAPHNFTYRGTFINGVLDEIDDMWFDDGLHVKATFENSSADFSEWNYCCSKDRRFLVEHIEGLQAVGPYSFQTNNRPAREVGQDYYDVEEGIYNPKIGLIINRPEPFSSMYVPCKEHVEWILNNCRHGSNIKVNISGDTYHKVIETNLESEVLMEDLGPDCNFNQRLLHRRYFGNLCKKDSRGPLEDQSSDVSDGNQLPDSSSSTCDSFSDRSVSLDAQDNMDNEWLYKTVKPGRDLEREQPTLVEEAANVAKKRFSSISFHQ